MDGEAYRKAQDARMALGRQRDGDAAWKAANGATYGWARLDEVITAPCPMWFSPWMFDPIDPEHRARRDRALAAIADGSFGYLSRFYWTTWSDKRPPISVLCPNGAEWCVDARSSNGDGWQVSGDPPLLVVTPSIQVPGYHGFLGSNGAPPGHFTGNL